MVYVLFFFPICSILPLFFNTVVLIFQEFTIHFYQIEKILSSSNNGAIKFYCILNFSSMLYLIWYCCIVFF